MLGWSIGGFRKSAIAALLSTFNYHYYSAHCSSLLCSIARPCSAHCLANRHGINVSLALCVLSTQGPIISDGPYELMLRFLLLSSLPVTN